jgi:hypothetical protein
VALLATFVARLVLMLLHKTLLVRLSFIFIYHMNSLVIHVVRQHYRGTLYHLWVVSTVHTFWYPLLQKNAEDKLLSLDVFSFVSFVAAAVGTGVPHLNSPTSTHDVNLL